MKIKKHMLISVSTDLTPDSADGEHVAITPEAQEITGLKAFTGRMQVLRDVNKTPKNLITKADVDEMLNRLPAVVVVDVTLTPNDIAHASVELARSVAEGTELIAKFRVDGSDWIYAGDGFNIMGNILRWGAYDDITAKLQAGDKMSVRYVAEGA